MSNEMIGVLSLLVTVLCYGVNKQLYRRFPTPLLMPILATPLVLIALLLLTHVSYPQYIAQTRWLAWMLGPTTVAFALPLHENRQLLRKHWLSITTGVVVASLVSISTTVWFADWFGLNEELQKVWPYAASHPFAIEAERVLGGPTDLAALFVVMTGITGMLIGGCCCVCCPMCAARWLPAPSWAVPPTAQGWPRPASLAKCRPWWPRW